MLSSCGKINQSIITFATLQVARERQVLFMSTRKYPTFYHTKDSQWVKKLNYWKKIVPKRL